MVKENTFSSQQFPDYILVPGSEVQVAANVSVPRELTGTRAEKPEERRNILDQPPFSWLAFEVPLPADLFVLEDDEDLQQEHSLYIQLLRLTLSIGRRAISTGNSLQQYQPLDKSEIDRIKKYLAPFWTHSAEKKIPDEILQKVILLCNNIQDFLESYPNLLEYLRTYWMFRSSPMYFDENGFALPKLLKSAMPVKTYGYFNADILARQERARLVGLSEVFRMQISQTLTGDAFQIFHTTKEK